MIAEDEAIKAAETLKEWCKGRMCRDCKFFIRNLNDCTFHQNGNPEDWHIPKPRRWTNGDIQLAKILKRLGVRRISYSSAGRPWWHTDCDNNTLPCGAFADLKPGETVPIDTIIKEGDAGEP